LTAGSGAEQYYHETERLSADHIILNNQRFQPVDCYLQVPNTGGSY